MLSHTLLWQRKTDGDFVSIRVLDAGPRKRNREYAPVFSLMVESRRPTAARRSPLKDVFGIVAPPAAHPEQLSPSKRADQLREIFVILRRRIRSGREIIARSADLESSHRIRAKRICAYIRSQALNAQVTTGESTQKHDTKQHVSAHHDSLCGMLVEASKDAMVAIDNTGSIIIFNPAAEQMFGHKRNDMIGQQMSCLMPEEYRNKHLGASQSYFRTGKPDTAIPPIIFNST